MKSFLYFTVIIVSIGLIIFGYSYYQDKLEKIAADSVETPAESAISNTEHTEEKVNMELTGLFKEWTDMVGEDEALAITVFGSQSITEEGQHDSWPTLLEKRLNEFKDAPSTELTVIDVGRTKSVEIKNEDYLTSIERSNPHILLFEPFLLNDLGDIRIEHSLQALSTTLAQLEDKLPDTIIVLLPAHPIYKAEAYSENIEKLEQFAADHDYVYANHWQSWPSIDNPDLKNYVKNARPNEQGHELWADAMLEFLTNE